MKTWKRASEITQPGAYWVDDRRPDGKPSPAKQWYVYHVLESRGIDRCLYALGMSISKSGAELRNWDRNIYLYGPIEPPGEMPQ